jgi:hypothetical protein
MKSLLPAITFLLCVFGCSRSEVYSYFVDAGRGAVTVADGGTLESDLLFRWNSSGAAATVVNSPQTFEWKTIGQFPHPTYRNGDPKAYSLFAEVLLKFFRTNDNLDFVKRNGFLDVPFSGGVTGSTKTWTFRQLVRELLDGSLVDGSYKSALMTLCAQISC